MTVAQLVALPGSWRSDPKSLVFSPCSVGFQGTDEQKQALAEERCCPVNVTTNVSICTNLMFIDAHEQCKVGFQGALCLVCADGWVPQGGGCIRCSTGSQMTLAFLVEAGLCCGVFVVVFLILVFSVKEEKVETAYSIFGQVKIAVSYLQIVASMPGVMESVPWPDLFLSFSLPLSAVNFNFLSFVSFSSCGLNLRFPQQFVVQMALPIFLSLACGCAYLLSNICGKSGASSRQHRSAQALKFLISIVLFCYPSLCTAVFTMFRCKHIPGVRDGAVLMADFSVRCNQGEHVMMAGLAIGCGVVYVLGIPLAVLLVLKKNRAHLYDETSKKHASVMYSLGGLYSQYEEKYWWF
jgi:hypothetical protein